MKLPDLPEMGPLWLTLRLAASATDVLVDLGPHRVLARITRRSLHDLELAVGSPIFALLKSMSLSRQRA